jgi:hypothetical protein
MDPGHERERSFMRSQGPLQTAKTCAIPIASKKIIKAKFVQVLSMKYTARHIQRFLEQGKIDPTLWANHFPSLLPSQVPTCEDCEDFKEKTCKGDRDPVGCFLSVKQEEEQSSEKSPRKKSKDPMLGIGSRRKIIPGGANKTYDQSKI